MRLVSDNNKLVNFFRTVYMILSVMFLVLSCLYRLPFFVGCSICTILFGFIRIWLVSVSRKEEERQKRKCKSVGFMLMIPALGMVANGIVLVFLADIVKCLSNDNIFIKERYFTRRITSSTVTILKLSDYTKIPTNLSYGAIVLLAVMAAGLSMHIFVFWKDSSLAAKFLRFTDCAALSSPVSLIVMLAMLQNSSESATAIGCMTAILLGCIALLIAVNMILTSFCGYETTAGSIRTVSALIRNNKPIIFRAVIVKDGFLVAGKLLISLASFSFFMFANGLYSVGMGVGRYIAINMHSHSEEEQIKSYRMVGGVILFSSICYVLYSIRLFFGGKSAAYPMVIALMIACYTFIEFGINIREMIRLRKSKALEAKALRALSFSSTLLCFVLTQTAIMSFAHPGDASFLNALSGVVFGGLAAFVGLYVILSFKRTSLK